VTAAGPRSRVQSLLRGWDILCDAATGLLFIAGAVFMFAMVVTRYGFAWSDPSVEIIVRYCMIWGTFVGISAGMRYGVNIRFTLIEHLLKDRGKRILRTFSHIATLLIAIALAVSGFTLADETMMFNEVMPTALRWPVWPFHAAVFAGGVLLSLQLIRSIVEVWRPDGEFAEDASAAGSV
jgi:TRAP-type C4-dicarboxylate transport system permease small subunit